MATDPFADFQDQGFGAFDGGAADQLDRLPTKIVQGGIETQGVPCSNCGQKSAIGSDWQEVITGSIGFVPPNWNVDKKSGTLFPNVGCAGCNRLIKVGYEPGELKRYVHSGIEQGFLTRQQADSAAQQVLQAAGRR